MSELQYENENFKQELQDQVSFYSIAKSVQGLNKTPNIQEISFDDDFRLEQEYNQFISKQQALEEQLKLEAITTETDRMDNLKWKIHKLKRSITNGMGGASQNMIMDGLRLLQKNKVRMERR